MQDNKIIDDEIIWKLTVLNELDISSNNKITNKSLDTLLNLKKLDLSDNKNIIGIRNIQLEWLDLSGICNI